MKVKFFRGAMYITGKGIGYIGLSTRKVWWCLWDGAKWFRKVVKR